MANDFKCDVFLSHSARDKAVVGALAERLRKARLKVSFDEWVLKPGDQTPETRSSRRESAQTSMPLGQSMSGLTSAATREEKIEEGLEDFQFGFRTSDLRSPACRRMRLARTGRSWRRARVGGATCPFATR